MEFYVISLYESYMFNIPLSVYINKCQAENNNKEEKKWVNKKDFKNPTVTQVYKQKLHIIIKSQSVALKVIDNI